MKKIILAVLFGMALTVLTNWISSREIKKETQAKEEKVIEKKAEQSISKKWDSYSGDWFSQNDRSIRISLVTQDQKQEPFKVIIYQNDNPTYTFVPQMNSNGSGEATNEKGITFHLELTHFYEKSSKQLKPSIEIYTNNNGAEKNFFIRAFR
jgi:hypothetical protein